MDLQKLKKHIRVDHKFEDDLIAEYLLWAEEEIKDSVSTSVNRNDEFFVDNKHFDKAVSLLVAHFFENRLPLSENNFHTLPFGVIGAIQKLRGGYFEEEQS